MSDQQTEPQGETLCYDIAQSDVMSSDEIGELGAALAKAQEAMEQPQKNKTATIELSKGGKYSYSYADLPTVIDHLKKALPKHGLSYVQRTRIDSNRLILDTVLVHSSGQWISSQWPLEVSKDPKQTAASLTYGRRYSLTSLCGISAEETDDDAERRGSGKNEPVIGALSKVKLQEAMRAFDTDLHKVSDEDELIALVEANKDALAQAERDLPSWYYTKPGSDTLGIKDRIDVKEVELRRAENQNPLNAG